MKKIIAGLLSLSLLIGVLMTSVVAGSRFSDTIGHWAANDIEWAAQNSLTTGAAENMFLPEMTLTRGTYVTFLYRLAALEGLDTDFSQTDTFEDVAADAWYAAAVQWAAEKQIAKGTDASHFSPNAAITREQIAAMNARFLENCTELELFADDTVAGFDDYPSISDYARQDVALNASAKYALMNGSDGCFRPTECATRAEAAAILHRLDNVLTRVSDRVCLGNVKNGTTPMFRFLKTDYITSVNELEGLFYDHLYGETETIRAFDYENGETYADAESFYLEYVGVQLSNNASYLYVFVVINDSYISSLDELHLVLDPKADFQRGDDPDSLIHLVATRTSGAAGLSGHCMGSTDLSCVDMHYANHYADNKQSWEFRIKLNQIGLDEDAYNGIKSCRRMGMNVYATSVGDSAHPERKSYSYVKRSNQTFGLEDAYAFDFFTLNGATATDERQEDLEDTELHPVILTNGEKVGRDDVVEDNGKTKLTAQLARNESEGMQFLLYNGAGATDVSFTVSDLVNDNGEKLESVTTYRQHYIEIVNSIAPGTKLGYLPDAIIPLFDGSDGGYANNKSDILPNQNQGYWITVSSSETQTPGLYTGYVTVSYQEGSDIIIPVEVEVWDITLPTTPSSQTSFDLDLFGYLYKYYVYRNDEVSRSITLSQLPKVYDSRRNVEWNLQMMYYDFFLDYRISSRYIPGTILDASNQADVIELIRTYATDERISAFQLPSFSRGTTIDMSKTAINSTAEIYKVCQELGIADKTFMYLIDEPNEDTAKAQAINRLNYFISQVEIAVGEGTNIPNIVTSDPVRYPTTADIITDWCPNWGKMTKTEMQQLIAQTTAKGNLVWWYTCVGPILPSTTYQIPDSLLSPRVSHWMQHEEGPTGEIYWSSAMWGNHSDTNTIDRDVWNNPCAFNDTTAGDGYLVYPGYWEDGIVNRNIPIPTLRLESIRDGLEDYELLLMMEKKLEGIAARLNLTEQSINDLMNTYYQAIYMTPESGYTTYASFDKDNGDVFLAAREMLAQDILSADDDVVVAVNTLSETKKEIVVYTSEFKKVTVDGEEIAGVNTGDHWVYTLTCGGSRSDIFEKTIVVGDSAYTRILNYKY